MRVPIAILATAAVALTAGTVWLVLGMVDWLGHPLAINSFAGLPVFRDATGQLGSYLPFELYPALTVVGIGITLVPIALVVGASITRSRGLRNPPRLTRG